MRAAVKQVLQSSRFPTNGLVGQYDLWTPNLGLWSEDFTNAAWVKSNVTVAGDSTANPVGGATNADTLTAGADNATCLQTIAMPASKTMYFGVWLKRKTGTGDIKLQTKAGATTTVTITGDWAFYQPTPLAIGGSNESNAFGIVIATNGDAVYAWGYQPYPASLPPYQATTTLQDNWTDKAVANGSMKNLLWRSEEFSNAIWSKTRSYVVPDVAANPINGRMDADLLVEDGTASNNHLVGSSNIETVGPATFSVFAKPAGRNWLMVDAYDLGHRSFFDLANGQLGLVADGSTNSIVAVGNGWYRCTTSRPIVSTMTFFASPAIGGAADGQQNYSGLGHSGTCQATGNDATHTKLASGASAVDDIYSHQPNTPGNKNLVWPACRADFSNGWLSGWLANGTGTVTYDATNGVAASGCAKCVMTDVAESGINSPSTTSGFPVAAGLAYSWSASVKTVGGNLPLNMTVTFYNAAGGWLSTPAWPITATTTHTRYSQNNVVAPANAAFAALAVKWGFGAGAGTFYVDEVQFEQSATATTYVTPTQGTPWGADFYRTGRTGGVANGPTALTPSAYNGSTKVLTHDSVATPSDSTTTYVVGPGIYLWGAQLEAGSVATPYEQTQTKLQRGSSMTAADSADFVALGTGAGFTGATYGLSGNLKNITLPGPFTLLIAAKATGAASATLLSIADANSTAEAQDLRVDANHKPYIATRSASSETTTTALGTAINAAYHVLALVCNGALLTLYNLSTGEQVSVASKAVTGTPRIGVGCSARSTVALIIPTATVLEVVLHNRALGIAELQAERRDIRTRQAKRGIAVL